MSGYKLLILGRAATRSDALHAGEAGLSQKFLCAKMLDFSIFDTKLHRLIVSFQRFRAKEVALKLKQRTVGPHRAVSAAELDRYFNSERLSSFYKEGMELRKEFAKEQESLRRIDETDLKFRYR